MSPTRWAVLGPGVIGGFFARALIRSDHGVLYAVGSRDLARAADFAATYGAAVSGSYQDILTRDDIEAVYIGTVHTTHAELAIAALESGCAVLCEKPVTPDPASTRAVLAAAQRCGRPFLEAYKYRFGPLAQTLRTLISDGAIGTPVHIDAAFGGAAASRTGRLFDPAVAGGAILDVGGYPASLAVGVATWAELIPAGTASEVLSAAGHVGDAGVDEWASAVTRLGRLVAATHTSIVFNQAPGTVIRGSAGAIELPNVWGSRTESGRDLVLRTVGESRTLTVPSIDPMAAEADAMSLALAEGRLEVPEMNWAETALVADLLAAWRGAID